MIAVLPYVLSVLSLITIAPIWMARSAILRGDQLSFRNYFKVSLGLWVGTLFLFAVYLWARGLRVLVAVPEVFFSLYMVALGATLAQLFFTLMFPKRQLDSYLQQVRMTFMVWLVTCALGIVFYPLTDAQIYAL